MTISNRAKKLKTTPSAIMQGHMTCASDPFSENNETGYLNYGTAENYLVNDLLLPKLNEKIEIQKEHIQYNVLYGMEDVRFVVANFLEKYLNIKDVNPENIIIQTGVSAICESLSFAMFDEGDTILVPTPYYSGFDYDFTKRFNCRFLKVSLSPEDEFKYSSSIIKKNLEKSDATVKAILVTHPNNPTGEILSEEVMDELIELCNEYDLDLISDEIYALSTFENKKHISLYQKAKDKGVRCHLLYGMAKDFALAGMKVGFYYSEDEELLESMKSLSYFHPVSTQTQLLIKNLLSDDSFLSNFIKTNNKRLNNIAVKLRRELSEFRFLESNAGLFQLLDLSQYCKTQEDEELIFNILLNDYKINLSPGSSLGLEKPGYFRVCFAKSESETTEFIKRMKSFFKKLENDF